MAIRPEPDAWHHKRGTLAEMVAALEELEQWRQHNGEHDKAAQVRQAIEGLHAGSFSVRVGATTYSVDGD